MNGDSTEYSVSDCLESASGVLGIPSINNGLSVNSIGNDAFRNCYDLTFITIPDSVTSISLNAFNDCPSLTSLSFSNPLLEAA